MSKFLLMFPIVIFLLASGCSKDSDNSDGLNLADTLVISNSDGSDLIVNEIKQELNGHTVDTASSTQDGKTHYDLVTDTLDITLEMEAGATFPFGETWSVMLNGTEYKYDVPNEDGIAEGDRNLAFIAGQLRQVIDHAADNIICKIFCKPFED